MLRKCTNGRLRRLFIALRSASAPHSSWECKLQMRIPTQRAGTARGEALLHAGILELHVHVSSSFIIQVFPTRNHGMVALGSEGSGWVFLSRNFILPHGRIWRSYQLRLPKPMHACCGAHGVGRCCIGQTFLLHGGIKWFPHAAALPILCNCWHADTVCSMHFLSTRVPAEKSQVLHKHGDTVLWRAS